MEKLSRKKSSDIKCWELFKCKKKTCPAFKSKDDRCWLLQGTHCRDQIQGKFLEKMEMCLNCKLFKSRIHNINEDNFLKDTFKVINTQLKEYKKIVDNRDKELRDISMELALGITEVFEALRKIASGDPTVRLTETSKIELIKKLKHMVNLTAKEIGEIVDQSHKIAIGLAEHFHVLNKLSKGDLGTRVSSRSNIELLEALKKVTNKTIKSISREINERMKAEAALRKAHYGLERRVKQRTAELRDTLSLLNATLESTTDGILVVDRAGKISSFNKKFMQIWHIPEAIMTSRNDDEALKFVLNQLDDPESFLLKVRELYDKPEVESYDVLTFKDGRVFERYSQPQKIGNSIIGRVWSFRDVTERKKSQDKLKESEEKYRQLFVAETDAIIVFDAKTQQIVDSNNAASRIYGYSRKEFLNKKRKHISVDSSLFEKSLQKVLSGKTVDIPLKFHRKKNGSIFPVEISAASFTSKGQKMVFEVIKDITERKQAEEALKESEGKFRAITSTAIDAIFLIDSDGKISYWNPAAEKMFGYKGDEALGKELHILLAPKRYHKEYKKGFKRFAKTGDGIAVGNTLEFFALKKDGTEFPIEVSTSALKIKNTWCSVGIVRDITDRKRAEEKLRKAEVRYRTVADFTHDWEYWETPNGSLKYVSPSCERITGFSPQHFIHDPNLISEIILSEDKDIWIKHRHDILDVQGPRSIIFRIRRKDGEIRWIEHVCQPITDKQYMFLGVRASNRDITKRKQAEEALKKSHKNLRALSSRITEIQEEEKRRLTRELHDQVGQPLTALSINLDYLLEQLSKKSETSIVSSLYDSKVLVKKIMTLIRNIMAFLRPRILDDYGLAAAIHWFSDRFSQRTKIPVVFKGGEIKQRLPHDVETNLFRIIQESLTNISKHANASKATITLEDLEGKVKLTIADDGVGFDPTNTNRKGLGLIGISERVEAMGGTLRVESSPGKGTRIIVEVKR